MERLLHFRSVSFPVRIREKSFLARLAARHLGYGHVAMVVGSTIYLHNVNVATFLARPSWVVHELKHVDQYKEHGFFGFLWKYLRDYLKNGYWNNRFEREARAAESDWSLLRRYDLSPYIPEGHAIRIHLT
jgi:hypothetical protein